MDILIQSVVQKARRSGSSVHIRYFEKKMEQSWEKSRNGKKRTLSGALGETTRKISYVIIRKPYTYLEPVVREMFEKAEDVEVILDRRDHKRPHESASFQTANRRRQPDRRQAVPMLDILINIEA
jgi:hypothetical protein